MEYFTSLNYTLQISDRQNSRNKLSTVKTAYIQGVDSITERPTAQQNAMINITFLNFNVQFVFVHWGQENLTM